SYCFLQTLPLASNALAIRIIFPSVRVIRASFSPTGLPASLGKRKKGASCSLFAILATITSILSMLLHRKTKRMSRNLPSQLLIK
ncbi:hypothetical protein D8T65_12155, partial [Vibrio vulnificus]